MCFQDAVVKFPVALYIYSMMNALKVSFSSAIKTPARQSKPQTDN